MRGFPRLISVLFDCFRYHVKSPTNCLALLAHRYFWCQFCRKYVLSGLEAKIGFVFCFSFFFFVFFSRFFFELYSIYIGSITDSRVRRRSLFRYYVGGYCCDNVCATYVQML